MGSAKQDSKHAFPVCTLTPEEVLEIINSTPISPVYKELTMEEYYLIEDVTNSLERLRQYQWRDFLGRYKIF